MPISYEIDRERGVIRTRMHGELSVAAIQDYRAALREAPDFDPGLNRLIDARGVARAFSPADTRRLADLLRIDEDANVPCRCAVVIDDPAQLGVMEVFQAYSRGRPAEYRAFRSTAEAEEWLDGAVRAPTPRTSSSPHHPEETMAQENRPNPPREGEEQDRGGYGDDTGAALEPRAAATHGDSAVGRENPSANPADADEALGNRVGGYGRTPDDTLEEGTRAPDGE